MTELLISAFLITTDQFSSFMFCHLFFNSSFFYRWTFPYFKSKWIRFSVFPACGGISPFQLPLFIPLSLQITNLNHAIPLLATYHIRIYACFPPLLLFSRTKVNIFLFSFVYFVIRIPIQFFKIILPLVFPSNAPPSNFPSASYNFLSHLRNPTPLFCSRTFFSLVFFPPSPHSSDPLTRLINEKPHYMFSCCW